MRASSHSRAFLRLLTALFTFGVVTSIILARQTSKAPKTTKAPTASSASPVDLNTASEKELDSLPGVGPATAKKIIAGRPYSSVDDLSKAGVSAREIAKITPLVKVSGAPGAAPSSSASNPSPQANPPAPSKPVPASRSKTASSSVSQGTPGPGTVWVNLDSGVYHYPNSRYYGKTKSGKYMSEADAEQAGYRAAKNEKKPR